jgi:nucleoside-diphosphate-sugar epimerase
MRLLVVGGGWFAGRAIVAEVLRRGWDVTVFNRGRTSALPAGVSFVRGDREDHADLARLAGHGPWDAVVDVAGSVPAVVRDIARVLAPVAGQYVLVSTVSVYRDWPHAPVDESSPLWPADPDYEPGTRRWDPDAYGPLKAGCELAVRREFGDSALLVRSHVILGPGEYVGRLPWWLRRVSQGGRVLAPAPPGRHIQPVDVRDVACFLTDLAEKGATGIFNVAAPPSGATYQDLLEACRAATGSDARFVWVDEPWLAERGVAEWTEIPLWRTLPTAWAMDTTRAQAAGLRCRPLAQTVRDTWQWLGSGGQPVEHERSAEHGISREREAQLLAEWDQAGFPAAGPC